MKVFNLIIMPKKRYDATLDALDRKIKDQEIEIGALRYENRRLGDIVATLEKFLTE